MVVTGEVIQSVFQIRTGSGIGTAFAMFWDTRHYLVTARHVFGERGDGLTPGQKISIDVFHDNRWVPLRCRIVGVGSGQNDIAVIAPRRKFTDFKSLVFRSNGITYAQDVYFLGYPHLLYGSVGKMNLNYPLPYVKKAIVSMINFEGQLLVLDGHNNEGFSGGPVAYKSIRDPNGPWHIAGVIAASSVVDEPVLDSNSESATPYKVSRDTGLIDCCPIEVAFGLIAANPIGFPDNTIYVSNIQWLQSYNPHGYMSRFPAIPQKY